MISVPNNLTDREYYLYSLRHTFRVNGDIVCPICGTQYKNHPLDMRLLDDQGEPYLNKLCEGIWGKL